jgi:hypothetical protein
LSDRLVARKNQAIFAVAALGVVLARLIEWKALGDVPHVMDEIAYAFQARTMASGHLSMPVALPRAAFALWFVDDRTSRFSIFPPGWPAVLALGLRVHAATWVNPLLHGGTVLVVATIARKVAGTRAQVAAAVAYAFSPQALILAASLMSHTLVAFGAALALYAGVSEPRRKTLLLGGSAIGLVLLARPLCGVVVGAGFAALAFLSVVRERASAARFAIALVPLVFACALLGAYNDALTGDPLRFPQTVWFDEHAPPLDTTFFRYAPGCNRLGFGPGHGCDEGIKNATHSIANALSNTGDNLTSWFLLAGGGPLVFLCFGFALAQRRGRVLALGVPVLATVALYALYWYAGTCYGARFYHAALPSLILLGAFGAVRIWRRSTHAFAAMSVLWLGANGVALGAALGELSDRYWGVDARFESADRFPPGNSLVMVAFKTDGVAMHHLRWTGFTSPDSKSRWRNSVRALSALTLNAPSDDGPLVFAKYHPAMVDDLRARFPNHVLYIYILGDRPEADQLAPYEGSVVSKIDRVTVWPRDNFDGYVVPEL